MNWARLGLALLILSKTIWNGLDPQGFYVDWAGLGLNNIKQNKS